MTNADVINIERPGTDSKVFAHTRWDALPMLAGLFHLAYLLAMYFLFPYTPLWIMLILGFVYALWVLDLRPPAFSPHHRLNAAFRASPHI